MTTHIVYVTFPTKKEAQQTVDALISRRLIACANISLVESRYTWKSKKVVGKEFVAICKTDKPKLVERAILDSHSYDVPCILSWKVKANKSFDAWVATSCKKKN